MRKSSKLIAGIMAGAMMISLTGCVVVTSPYRHHPRHCRKVVTKRRRCVHRRHHRCMRWRWVRHVRWDC